MDASGEVSLEQQLKQMLECKICFENKERQKLLPCQHTICLDCLNELKIVGSSYKCPLCMKELLVPNGGFEALQESLITKQLASLIALKGGAIPGAGIPGAATAPAGLPVPKPAPRAPASVDSTTLMASLSSLRIADASSADVEAAKQKVQELKEQAEKKVAEGKEKLVKLDEEITEADRMCTMLKDSVQRILDDTMNRLIENSGKKTTAIDESADELKVDIAKKRDDMQKLIKKTEAEVVKLEEQASEVIPNMEEATGAVKELEELIEKPVASSKKLKPGDSVRLKLDSESLNPEFLLNTLTHQGVGYMVELEKDGSCEVMFEDCGLWRGKLAGIQMSERKHNLPQIGDWVKVKSTVSDPRYKWGLVEPSSVGILFDIKTKGENRLAFIDFDEDHNWKGAVQEIEKAPPRPLKVGDKVWISRKVTEPARGWAGVKQSSIGMVVSIVNNEVEIDFPECKGWKGLLEEVEVCRRPYVGDHVKVRADVSRPQFDWGGIDQDQVGKIARILNTDEQVSPVIKVDFPGRVMHWQGLLSEMEVVRRVNGTDPTTEPRAEDDDDDERVRCPTQ